MDELKKLCGVTFVKTVGQANTIWTDLRLGQTYGWGIDLQDQETKEAERGRLKSLRGDYRTRRCNGPSCDGIGAV